MTEATTSPKSCLYFHYNKTLGDFRKSRKVLSPEDSSSSEEVSDSRLDTDQTSEEVGLLCVLLQSCSERAKFCVSSPGDPCLLLSPPEPVAAKSNFSLVLSRGSDPGRESKFERALLAYPDLPRFFRYYHINKSLLSERSKKELLDQENYIATGGICDLNDLGGDTTIPELMLCFTCVRMKWAVLRSVWATKDPRRFTYSKPEIPSCFATSSEKTLYLVERLAHVSTLSGMLWKTKCLQASGCSETSSQAPSARRVGYKPFEEVAADAKLKYVEIGDSFDSNFCYFESGIKYHFQCKSHEMDLLIENAKSSREVVPILEPDIFTIFSSPGETTSTSDQIVRALIAQEDWRADLGNELDNDSWLMDAQNSEILEFMFHTVNELEEEVKRALSSFQPELKC